MKVSAIQNTYGSPSGAAKQLSEPIFSLGAGYHRFFARPGATVLQNFVETGATVNPLQGKYVPLFRASKQNLNFKQSGPSKTVQYGDYRGNYILYKYVAQHDLKRLTREMQFQQYPSADSTEGSEIIGRALADITQKINTLGDTITSTKGLRSAEEQSAAIGLKGQVKGKGRANPVDLDVKGQGYQVTYTKEYEKLSGHSIYGGLGRQLRSNISKIRSAQERHGTSKRKMHKNISKAGLSYFQKRLPMWNQIMKQVQGNQKMSARTLRGDIQGAMVSGLAQNPNQRIEGIAMRGFRGNLYNSTGFFHNAASQMTLQSLGNAAKYQEGVFNVTPIDNGVHSLVGLFMLTADPVWRYKESEMKYAHVSYGLDSTSPIIASEFTKLDALGINRMKSHAQQFVDARTTSDTGKVGEMMTTTAAQHLSGGVRLLPSMNIMAANKELSTWVSNVLLPNLRNAASGAARNIDGKSILGSGFTERMGKANFTALPYLSVFDSVLSRYGSK